MAPLNNALHDRYTEEPCRDGLLVRQDIYYDIIPIPVCEIYV